MFDYEEVCPVSKAASLLCERWTLQVLREMFMGATRFSEFRQYLPKMSPTLLNSRLKLLEEQGLIIKKRIPEKKNHEYQLTPMGRAVRPIIAEMGKWGIRYAWESMNKQAMNAAVLVRDFAVALRFEQLPEGNFCLQFNVQEAEGLYQCFVTIAEGRAERCEENIGHDVDLYLTADLETLARVWYGELAPANAVESGLLKVVGHSYLAKTLSQWLGVSQFADCNPRRASG
ncbi:helix-turn-helix domain-containing protein [Halioxenophilus sp. WMMB6]|uniref:helix-turn-helix domain-containing protein n=1 Tax=Halioxenophilus sp. WMMB6 TaxID=3073815 RepID=UPI00295F2786|nr:helix-turn-helix domain-containing protein [Halioxenophilus sp. WMMB6]